MTNETVHRHVTQVIPSSLLHPPVVFLVYTTLACSLLFSLSEIILKHKSWQKRGKILFDLGLHSTHTLSILLAARPFVETKLRVSQLTDRLLGQRHSTQHYADYSS